MPATSQSTSCSQPVETVIVEVDHLPPSEVDIRAFVITLLLSRLRGVQSAAQQSRKWLLVIEEAHNILERDLESRRPSIESNGGRTLVRSVDRLLQEGRELQIGVVVVDQSPCRLARSVISNTNTKIVMRLEDGGEMEEIGRAMGLTTEEWSKLCYLQLGEALVKASHMDTPVKTVSGRQSVPLGDDGERPGPNASVSRPSCTH